MADWIGRIALGALLTIGLGSQIPTRAAPAPTLDFEFFKTRVQPVFLEKRPTHTRCVVCHAESNNGFRLEPLSPGAASWTDEQSRKNFEMAAKLVNPGDPGTSRL